MNRQHFLSTKARWAAWVWSRFRSEANSQGAFVAHIFLTAIVVTLGIRKGKASKIPAFFCLIHTLPPRQLGSCSVDFGDHQDLTTGIGGFCKCIIAVHTVWGCISQPSRKTLTDPRPSMAMLESTALLNWGTGMTSSESCQRIPSIMSCINSACEAFSASLCLIKHLDYSLASTDWQIVGGSQAALEGGFLNKRCSGRASPVSGGVWNKGGDCRGSGCCLLWQRSWFV